MAGTHRKPRDASTKRAVATVAATGTLGAGLALGTGSEASAAPVSVWDRVAQCESGGRWHYNGSSGYDGGLQFSPSTWRAYKSAGYPAYAYQASKGQQIRVAERVLASQGPGAWPVCSVKAGLAKGMGAPYGKAVKKAPKLKKKSVPVTTQAAMAVAFARAQIGKPYVYGATGPRSFDCSGLTQAAWRAAGVKIPRTSQGQLAGLTRVSPSSVRPGDLVIYKRAGHVGIYVGNGKIIEAPRPGATVKYSPWRSGWYAANFVAVVRPHSKTVTTQGTSTPAQPGPASGGYKVRAGDWLSTIAPKYHTTWQKLYALNRGRLNSPHLIYPGQVLRLK